MTLNEATVQGIRRLRLPNWANPHTYLLLDLFEGGLRGPWLHLYDRLCQERIGEPTPQNLLGLGDTTADYEAYTGPLDPADTAPQDTE